jgi:hypothetical protein
MPLHLQGTSALLKAICSLFGRPLRVDKEGGAGGVGGGGNCSRSGCLGGNRGPRCAQDVAAERRMHQVRLDSFKVHYHMHVRPTLATFILFFHVLSRCDGNGQ